MAFKSKEGSDQLIIVSSVQMVVSKDKTQSFYN